MIAGSMVALVTPMDAQGSLDWDSLSKLVDFHLQEGTNAIVAVGTTGESATLEVTEHIEAIRRVVDQVAGRIPVIAGTGGNSTRESVELTRAAKDVGADACLLVTPYYNKPTQEGLYQHFKAIAEAVPGMSQMLYNVPGRTACDMLNETVLRLADIPNIVGIKDATGNIPRGAELIEALNRVKNSFNSYPIDRIAEIAAVISFEDVDYFVACREKIIATRSWVVAQLQTLGFVVLSSQANFVFVKPKGITAAELEVENARSCAGNILAKKLLGVCLVKKYTISK